MFFNKKESSSKVKNWIELQDLSQLNELKEHSFTQKIIIFKHSTRCSISNMALRVFENSFDFENENYKSYFLDLISFRNISNEIATQYQVTHQSPQVLVIENGVCIQNESHEDISEMKF